MTTASTKPTAPATPPADADGRRGRVLRLLGLLVGDRIALLAVLLVVLLVWMKLLDWNGYLVAPYDATYLASSQIGRAHV